MMKTILLCLTLLTLSLLPEISFGNIHVDTVYVYTTFQAADSSHLFLTATSRYPYTPCQYEDLTIIDTLGLTTVRFCTTGGWIPSFCTRTDTVDLGYRPNGILNVQAIFTYGDTHCPNSLFIDTVNLIYDIEPNAISNIKAASAVLSVHPNPVHTSVTLTVDESLMGSMASITDLTGRVLLKTEVRAQKTEIGTATLPSGIYLVTIEANDGRRWVKKLVKE